MPIAAANPALALRAYIAAKLQSSRQRPDGSRVFTQEVMAGALLLPAEPGGG